jgi:hypothetical protein
MTKRLICATFFAGAALLTAQTAWTTKTFATAEEAADALVKAAAGGVEAVRELFGPSSAGMVRTGDSVQDKQVLEQFQRRAAEKTKLEPDPMNRDRVTLLIGAEEWPFAVPVVRKNGRWLFDTVEGKAELRRRIIGGNELDTIQVCLGYVEAQQTYAETDWDGNGVLEFAKKIASTEGKKDGLFWPGEDSPVAANFAKAAAQGYGPPSAGKGYHGYHYKVLLAQGPEATSGAQDYVAHGLVIGGFALAAWPVEYGVSGIMTFIVNQDGVVYQKDLGPQTAALAKAITKFNPDKSWSVAPEVGPVDE